MVSKDVIEDVTEDWNSVITSENVIHRDITDDIEKTIGFEEVTVIKGVRRAGKTFTLYELFQKYGGIYINFEDERLYDFSNKDFEKVMDIIDHKKVKFLYLDEVHEIEGWEKFAHRSHRKVKIFVTGSNSRLLTSEYSKSLVGRIKSYTIYPLSYSEFLRFRKLKVNRNSLLDHLKLGGFPRIVITGDQGLAKEYLDRMIYRDILGRVHVKHPEAIKTLALYLLSNVGKEFSYRSLKAVCGLKHENTVKNYLGMLKDAYLLHVVNQYHASLRVQESYGKKVYSIDPSLIYLGKRMGDDSGRILENAVFLHLLRKEHDIYFGKNKKEVDFIICEGTKPVEILNVTYNVENKTTRERELSSLQYFMTRLGVPGGIITIYPFKAPDEIDLHLAHRFLR